MNAVLVDSNVVLDLFTADARYCEPVMALLSFWGSMSCVSTISCMQRSQ